MRRFAVNFLIMAVSLAVVLGGAEFGIRTFYPKRVRTYFEDQTETALGRPVPKKVPGEYRIFIFGGSSAYGFPLSDRFSINAWLRKNFSILLPNRKIRVINTGWPGKGSHHVLEGALNVMQYEPDLFIIYDGHNEFYIANRLYLDNAFYRLGLQLNHRSAAYRLYSHRLNKLRKHKVLILARDLDGHAARARSSLEQLIREIADRHKKPLLNLVDIFEKASPHETIGNDLIYDNVYPTGQAQLLIADLISKKMSEEGKIAPAGEWNWPALRASRLNQPESWITENVNFTTHTYILREIQLWEQKHYEEGMRDFEKGLEYAPDFFELYVFMADNYWHLGEKDKADKLFNIFKTKDPDAFQRALEKYPDLKQTYVQMKQTS